MIEYTISNDQFNNDPDMPDRQLILEALQEVLNAVDVNGVSIYKGNYEFYFWRENETSKYIQCNAYLLMNPDNPNDSRTEGLYDFDISEVNHVSG